MVLVIEKVLIASYYYPSVNLIIG